MRIVTKENNSLEITRYICLGKITLKIHNCRLLIFSYGMLKVKKKERIISTQLADFQ